MSRIRNSLTYANVMATIAVFLALGGGAYAATQLPKNSVGTRQIKKNAITSAKVKDRSLLKQDFKAGQLPAGPQGVQGPKGDKGDTGPAGADATKLFAFVKETTTSGPATVVYGRGVTAAARSSAGVYTVTFDRALTGCIVIAEPGTLNPNPGGVLYFQSFAAVQVGTTSAVVYLDDYTGNYVDTNFFVAAFC